VWDAHTGKPIFNAIVWQCRRTKPFCEKLKAEGYAPMIQQKTGLVVDSYFSASKIQWILEHVSGAKKRAEEGELLFGTVDSWLLWKLSGGKVHATDYSNASRTMLFNIHTLDWDDELLQLFDIPRCMLPEVKDSSGVYAQVEDDHHGLKGLPIAGIIGDQQGALFGQRCWQPGLAKNTYGTGCFLLMNVGAHPVASEHGLLSTIAWGLDGKVTYALEGSVFMGGATIQWLRDEMGLIRKASETEEMAKAVPDNGGVYLVPAFAGLGAPYWDMDARGILIGLTRGTNRYHVVRAALESICYQTKDVLDLMVSESGVHLTSLQVDGGATVNNFLMQYQSDILDVKVVRPQVVETTAFGAAVLAGLGVQYYQDLDELMGSADIGRIFDPDMEEKWRTLVYADWRRAVERSRHWNQR